ncbi:TIP41-like protein isoform X7 [Solanum dulcamara]|uniref:TIP41-like protein isoform X7 n=1 Tax=Solanum dulcamara TaxID=45834 RepID=UPI0024863132|nr:TIP41-like protein isoform X7 [Solanum dulcamara]
MEWESDDKELKAAGAEPLPAGRRGVRIHGWEIDCRKLFILNSVHLQRWEKELQTTHLPEMVFGDNCLVLKHMNSGTKLFFNAFDALVGWKHEALSPVEVPAAAKWKFRSKPLQQVVLDYDYTFTTPYCGSETVERNVECGSAIPEEGSSCIQWEDCKEKIDLVALASKEPILFYDEIILYEDELADNGISLLTIKVKGYPSDAAAYSDPSIIADRLPIVMQKTQKLNIGVSYDQNLVYIGVVQNPIAISGPASPRNQPQQTSS